MVAGGLSILANTLGIISFFLDHGSNVFTEKTEPCMKKLGRSWDHVSGLGKVIVDKRLYYQRKYIDKVLNEGTELNFSQNHWLDELKLIEEKVSNITYCEAYEGCNKIGGCRVVKSQKCSYTVCTTGAHRNARTKCRTTSVPQNCVNHYEWIPYNPIKCKIEHSFKDMLSKVIADPENYFCENGSFLGPSEREKFLSDFENFISSTAAVVRNGFEFK